MITIEDDIEYYAAKNFIYKIHKNKQNGEIRDNICAIWGSTRKYNTQIATIPTHEMRKISKQEANDICRQWYKNKK